MTSRQPSPAPTTSRLSAEASVPPAEGRAQGRDKARAVLCEVKASPRDRRAHTQADVVHVDIGELATEMEVPWDRLQGSQAEALQDGEQRGQFDHLPAGAPEPEITGRPRLAGAQRDAAEVALARGSATGG